MNSTKEKFGPFVIIAKRLNTGEIALASLARQ